MEQLSLSLSRPLSQSTVTGRSKPRPTQADRVLSILKSGQTLTPAQAYEIIGSLALHSRIAELRERGHEITCTIRTDGGKRWGEYRLVNS